MASNRADPRPLRPRRRQIMPITRPWKIVGAATAVAGLGIAGASAGPDGIDLQDRTDPVALTSAPAAVHGAPADTDDSPESADSPGDSPFDSPAPLPPPAPAPVSADSPPSAVSADSPESAASDD